MLSKSMHVKKYSSAEKRFLAPAIKQFFISEFPKYFGPKVAESIAYEMIKIFDHHRQDTQKMQTGQILWNALDKNTRADSPKVKFVPVILTLVNQLDIKNYVKGDKAKNIAKNTVARMIYEAYQQGGILSMRDIALLTLRDDSWVGRIRIAYEKENNVVLPHTGALHDMGSCITHKVQIIYKVLVEKKDPTLVAQETNHSQKAVDHYLHSYHRVITVFKKDPDIDHIHFVTKISKHVIKQYIEIYDQYVKPIS